MNRRAKEVLFAHLEAAHKEYADAKEEYGVARERLLHAELRFTAVFEDLRSEFLGPTSKLEPATLVRGFPRAR